MDVQKSQEVKEKQEIQKLFTELEKKIKTLNKEQLKYLISLAVNLKPSQRQ